MVGESCPPTPNFPKGKPCSCVSTLMIIGCFLLFQNGNICSGYRRMRLYLDKGACASKWGAPIHMRICAIHMRICLCACLLEPPFWWNGKKYWSVLLSEQFQTYFTYIGYIFSLLTILFVYSWCLIFRTLRFEIF